MRLVMMHGDLVVSSEHPHLSDSKWPMSCVQRMNGYLLVEAYNHLDKSEGWLLTIYARGLFLLVADI